MGEGIEKIRERFSIQDSETTPLTKLYGSNYRTSITFFGEDHQEDSNYEIGVIDLFVEAKTGNIKTYPTFLGFENETDIMGDDLLEWANMDDYGYRQTLRSVRIIAMCLHELNEKGSVTLDHVTLESNDHIHRILFRLKESSLEFRYTLIKQNGKALLTASLHEEEKVDIETHNNTFRQWETIEKELREHPSIRLLLLTED